MQDITTFITNHPYMIAALGILFVLLLIIEFIRARRGSFNISSLQATQKINHDNAAVIDVRANEAYRKGHIIDAISLSGKEIQDNTKKLEKFKNKPLIIVCTAGIESQKIASMLLKRGYNAFSLSGGMRAWMDAQLPVVKE